MTIQQGDCNTKGELASSVTRSNSEGEEQQHAGSIQSNSSLFRGVPKHCDCLGQLGHWPRDLSPSQRDGQGTSALRPDDDQITVKWPAGDTATEADFKLLSRIVEENWHVEHPSHGHPRDSEGSRSSPRPYAVGVHLKGFSRGGVTPVAHVARAPLSLGGVLSLKAVGYWEQPRWAELGPRRGVRDEVGGQEGWCRVGMLGLVWVHWPAVSDVELGPGVRGGGM